MNNKFLLISLCVLLIMTTVFGLTLYLRIAIGANAIAMLANVILSFRSFTSKRRYNATHKTKL